MNIDTKLVVDMYMSMGMSVDEIMLAFVSNDHEKVNKLMTTHNNKKKLFAAILDSNVGEVRHLISSGVDINCHNSSKQTPLFVACVIENEMMVRELINLGADVNFISAFGETPLMHASLMGFQNIKNILIESGTINK